MRLSNVPQVSLRRNFAWSLLGNVAYAGCQWGVLVVLAKLGTVEMVGQYGFALALTAPVFMLANLGLGGVLATDARGEHDFAEYAGARVSTTLAALLLSVGFASVSHYGRASAAVVIAIAASKAVESLSELLCGLFQQREAMDRVGKSMLFRGVLSLCAAAAAVRFAPSALAAASAVLGAWAIVLVQFDLVNGASLLGGARALIPRLKAATIFRIVRATLPLGIIVMLISLTTNIPRYFLEHERGTQDLGIFVGIAYISAPATLVVGSLGKAVMARLSILYANREVNAFRDLVRILVLCSAGAGAVGVVAAVLAGGPLLRLLYTAEYSSHGTALVIVMLSTGIGYIASSLGYAVTAAREFAAQIPVYVLVAASVAVCSAALVPRFGVVGATWALVAGALVQLGTYGWLYARLSWRCARQPDGRMIGASGNRDSML